VVKDIKDAGTATKDAAITVKDKTVEGAKVAKDKVEEGAEALKDKIEKEWHEKWLL